VSLSVTEVAGGEMAVVKRLAVAVPVAVPETVGAMQILALTGPEP